MATFSSVQYLYLIYFFDFQEIRLNRPTYFISLIVYGFTVIKGVTDHPLYLSLYNQLIVFKWNLPKIFSKMDTLEG